MTKQLEKYANNFIFVAGWVLAERGQQTLQISFLSECEKKERANVLSTKYFLTLAALLI
jgi:hypothetical protein